MSIYKHENGRYYYNFMMDGKRYHGACKTTDPKTARKIELEAMDAACRGNSEYFKKKKNVTFKQAIDLYMEYSKANKLSHKADVCQKKAVLEYFGAKRDIETITPSDIEKFKEFLTYREAEETIKIKNPDYGKKGVRKQFIHKKIKLKKTRTNATKNRYIAMLRKMFNLCIDNGLLEKNPCTGVKYLREDNKQRRILEPDEEKRIFDTIRKNPDEYGYLEDIILFALQTGARAGNILPAEWKQVDFKSSSVEFLKTKSGKAYKIPMTKRLAAMLKRRFAQAETPYIFPNPATGLPYKDIKKSFKSLMKLAGVENFTLHCCRHTVATRIIEKNGDIIATMDILGHANIKTTMIYHHLNEDRKRKAIESLE